MTIAFGGSGRAPYSPGVLSGGFVFLSGQVGFDTAAGRLVGPDVVAQTAQCLTNIRDLLAQQDLTLADLVSVTVYLTDIDDWPVMNEEYAKHFDPDLPLPTRTAIAVQALPMGAVVEMTCIAARRTS
jgi:2-iminobutanoate/2-iminopropanoate deaminase